MAAAPRLAPTCAESAVRGGEVNVCNAPLRGSESGSRVSRSLVGEAGGDV